MYLPSRQSHSQESNTPISNPPSDDEIFRDWLETDTIVNSVVELSPVITLSDLADVIPEDDEYRAMPHSLRHVLTPPTLYHESSGRPRSILFEPALPQIPQNITLPSSPYSKPRLSPKSDSPHSGIFPARQSVSSIGSCSTLQTRTAVPIKSILTRHDSGVSMATTTKTNRRRKKRSTPSVKFVNAPTIHYDDGVYYNAPPPRSPPSPISENPKVKPGRWFTRLWRGTPSPPPKPVISGPYNLCCTASLVDVYSSRSPKPKPGRLKQLWLRLTSMVS